MHDHVRWLVSSCLSHQVEFPVFADENIPDTNVLMQETLFISTAEQEGMVQDSSPRCPLYPNLENKIAVEELNKLLKPLHFKI